MKKATRRAGAAKPVYREDFAIRQERSGLREYGPMVFGGAMLVMAFAFAGHYMGQSAIAHNAEPADTLQAVVAPSSNLIAKGSLMPNGTSLDIVNLMPARGQTVEAAGKSDIIEPPAKKAVAEAKPDAGIQIIPAAVNLTEPQPEKKKLALAPPKPKLKAERKEANDEKAKQTRAEKQKAVAQRRVKLAEENCLARAVYFEARSESELGQLAVAKVILNRVKDPEYPNTICGVVYQGSGRRNSCQFSFACDGLPDDVRSATSWAKAKKIAQKAIAGEGKIAAIGTATNYHADYVKPKWAKSMKRLIKIGRHVFYEDS